MSLEPTGDAKLSAVKDGEILITCRPHSEGTTRISPYRFRKDTESIVFGFLLVWLSAFLISHHLLDAYVLLVLSSIASAVIIPMFAFRRGITHIRCNPIALQLQWELAGKVRRSRCFYWSQIKGIHIRTSRKGVLDSTMVIELTYGTKYKLKLSKIATSREWHKLFEAIRLWSPVPLEDVDEHLFDSLSATTAYEQSYTALWLDALSAPPRAESLKPLEEGAIVRHYRVLRILASGGQGTAYLASAIEGASRPDQPEFVVLKEYVLPVYVDIRARRQAIARFEKEARILSSLDNPLIVKLLEFFVSEHKAYLVLEYIDGPSLRKLLADDGTVLQTDVIAFGKMMCRILEYLHGHEPPVVHRDFTPDNLILSQAAELKLIDFMVAQAAAESDTPTVVGKHAYLPPEQFRGKATMQSDIYALGACLYFCLTGADPEPLSTSHPLLTNDQVMPQLDAIVARCTALDLSQRYSCATEVLRDLQEITVAKSHS